MSNSNLRKLGLTDKLQQEALLYKGLHLARVTAQHHDLYKVYSAQGELMASVRGKMIYQAENNIDFPVVGDWVMIDRTNDLNGNAVIHNVLKRKSSFARKAAGTSNTTQIVAANIDVVFICMSLNADFNLRRVERYLSIAWDSMAKPVIVLTKADLCEDVDRHLREIDEVAIGTDVVVCSSLEENGYEDVKPYITEGKTVAFIGSSGVGKSTLINRLLGQEILVTRKIREDDDKGRHATTHRELFIIPDGGIVIDTPGMREIQIESGNLSKSFEDIADLAAGCRYKDCSHSAEPGCAVLQAIQDGELSQERFDSYKKLQKEIGYEGLNSRQLEQEKINRMFGSMGEMKQLMRHVKNKNKR